jgi:hypothetical protein
MRAGGLERTVVAMRRRLLSSFAVALLLAAVSQLGDTSSLAGGGAGSVTVNSVSFTVSSGNVEAFSFQFDVSGFIKPTGFGTCSSGPGTTSYSGGRPCRSISWAADADQLGGPVSRASE